MTNAIPFWAWFDELFWYPLLGGTGVALMCGPLGVFMTWHRLSAFSDSLAHATLLGVALSLMLSINLWISLLVTPLIAAWILAYSLSQRNHTEPEGLLMIISQGAMALSFISLALTGIPATDLSSYLFGDILTFSLLDIGLIYGGASLILTLLIFLWKPLILVTMNEDLAAAEGYSVNQIRFVLLTLMALCLGFSLKMMGALLLSTLLIFPALTVRIMSRSPEQMCIFASILGIIWVILGLLSSFLTDIPTGPTITAIALVCFCVSHAFPQN